VSVACGKELTYQFLAKSLVVSYEDQMLYRFTVHFIYLYFVIFFIVISKAKVNCCRNSTSKFLLEINEELFHFRNS